MSGQRHLGGGQVHLVPGQDGRIISGPQVVILSVLVPFRVLDPSGLDPAHLDGMDQLRDLLLLQQRWDEAAFVLWPISNWVDHHLIAEELHLGLLRWVGEVRAQ